MKPSRLFLWFKFIGLHFRGRTRLLLRRFSWELIQTFIGFWAGSVAILRFRHDVKLKAWGNAIVLRGYRKRKYWGGVCFGAVILGDARIEAEVNNALFMHEYGHCLQSAELGPIYLSRFGLPSLISARGTGIHNTHPVEQDANLRAKAFFETVNGFVRWPQEIHPIQAESEQIKVRFWEYLPGPFPFAHLAVAGRQWWQAKRKGA